MFVIAGTLARSGLTQHLADGLLKVAARPSLVSPLLMAVAAALSAFFSNTSATGMLMPATQRIAQRTNRPAGQLLMPLAFASILGGTCTLIGTSTNLAGASLMTRLGMAPFTLFEFTLVGVLVTVAGIAYLALVGYRTIPQRDADDLSDAYHVRDYLAQLGIAEGSDAVGKTITSLKLRDRDMTPLAVVRDNKRLSARGNRKLAAGDIDWEHIFGDHGSRWFHTGGIFAALSATAPDVIIEALKCAKKHGTMTSYDLNYRPSLW